MPDIFDTIEAPTTSAGGDIFDTIPETIAPIKRENARRIFDPAFEKEVTPILTELETQARQGGVFGAAPAGSFLDLNNTLDKFVTPEEGSEGPVLAAKRKYAETRDAFANTFDLTPDEADDFVKHRAGLQTAGVSKDTFGQIHIKDETLAKPIDEIRKEISASNLPDDVKAKYTAEDSPELDLKVAGFKANTVASVVKNHPELAAEIGITGDEKQLDQDFAKLTKELNASVSEQLVSGVGPGLSRSVSELEHIGGLFEDKLDFSDKVPYLEQRSREIERRQKYRESLNQLSSQLNESKTQLFGTDAATIGGGLYSAAESVAITALTGPAAAELVPARLLGGAVKAAVAVQPVSALYATRQASDTYEQAIEAGKTPEEAQELAAKAFGIEWGFTTAFSAAGAGGLEDIGTKLGQEAVKKSFKGATGEILKTTLGENAEEGLINLFQTVAVDAKLNPHLTEDDLKKRAYDTFVATTLATGPISVAAETLKPTHEQTTEELHDTADKIYSEKVLSETEDQGGDVEAPSLPSVVTRAELEAERNKRIGELTDPEEIAALKDVDLDELAEDWGVELKAEETPVIQPKTLEEKAQKLTEDHNRQMESAKKALTETSEDGPPLPPTEMTERAKAPGERVVQNPAVTKVGDKIETEPEELFDSKTYIAQRVSEGLTREEAIAELETKRNAYRGKDLPEGTLIHAPDAPGANSELKAGRKSSGTWEKQSDGSWVLLDENGDTTTVKHPHAQALNGGEITQLGKKQNDNKQPTTPPQLEVPVSPVPAVESGAEGSSIPPTAEQSAVELPAVAGSEATPVATPFARNQPVNITLEDGSTETGRIVGIVPDGTYNVAGPSGIIMNKKVSELTPIEDEQNIPKPQEVPSVPVPKVPTGTTPQQDTKPDSSNAKTTETAKKEIETSLKDEISAPEDFISALAEAMGLAGRVTVTNKGKGELQQGKKGAVDFKGTASALISLFKSADQSTAVHEMSHVARRFLFNRDIAPENRLGISDADITAAEEFSGAKDGVWNRAAEEKFARGFERYVRDGKFPSDKKVEVLFSKLAKWLQSIYKVVAGSSLDIELSDEIREVFDNLITRGQIIPAPAKPATAPATAKPKRKLPPRTAPPKTTSVKNAETDKELEALGLSPVYDPGKKALQETWDESLAVVSKDRFAGKKLVQELLEKPRSISDVEHGVLLDELAKSKLRAAKAQEELFAAQKAGVKVNDVQKELETARQDIIRVVKASKLAGTEWGRAGRFRQIRIEEDYTIEAMTAHYQAVVNDGAPLSKPTDLGKDGKPLGKNSDESFIKELQDKITKAEAEVVRLNAEVGEQARTVAGLLKKLAERAKVRAPSKARAGTHVANLNARKEEALARLRARDIGTLYQEEESSDSEYLDAVERGDVETQQRLVDEAAKAAGYSTGPLFHGSQNAGFTKFKQTGAPQGDVLGEAFYFTDDEGHARTYAEEIMPEDADFMEWMDNFNERGKPLAPKGGVYKVHLKINNAFDVTDSKSPYKDARDARREGHDAVIYKTPRSTPTGYEMGLREVAVFDPNQIKSAEPITRDANGKVIPLSERFNPESDSILYQDEETPQRDPSIIDDLGIVGATWLQEGVREFDAFTEKLVKEFGEDFREVAKQVFEVAQIEFKESATKARAKTPQELMNLLDPENPELSNKLIYNMVRGFINQGLEGPKVLDAVTKLLQEEFPDITREDVAIAFTQYGKVKFPSQEEDLKKARELRELERIQLQIDDINAGRAPKKTGQQRDKPSVDIRELQKQRNELLKALNIKAVQKTQLRSSLDAVKTRLRNEIEELNHAIATKVAQVKRKPSPASDAEVLALKAKRDQVKDHYNAVFGINKKAVTDQQRLNTALKGLNKRIAEERALAAKGLAERTKNGKPISNAQVDALRKTLNALVKQRQQLRAALHPKQSIEEREMKRAETAAKRAISAYTSPTTKGKLHLTPSKELARLWELRDSMKAAAEAARKHARSLTRKSPEAIAYAARLKALEKSVADIEARVKRGDLSTKGKKLGPETLAVTELKKRQKAAQDALDALRAALDTRTPEERRDAALVRAANTRRQKIEARIKANDYVKVAPVPRVKSAALIKALHDEALAKAEWNEKFFAAELAKRSKWEKSRDAIGEVVNVSRTMMTMADVSAVFRQGGLGFLAHPILGARSIPGMINSGLSEAKALSRYHALQARPNAALAQEAKLFIAKMGPNVSLTEMEEAFRGRVAKKIPGIKQVANFSERTYADFLNHLRMDMFDAMVAGLPSVGGRVTTAEAKVIADYINKSTGRGNLGDSENAAATLAAVFFSPKFVASRFQWLWGIVPTAFNVATGFTLVPKDVRRAKKAIAKEYTRTFIGIAAVYTLSALAKAAWGDDDDKWEFDPRSSAAGKIKVGPNTFVDPMAGLLQASTFGSRMLPTMHKGKWGVYTKGPKGVTSLTNAGFGKTGYADVAWTFTRSKFSPAVGTWINMGTGQDLGRNKVTPQSEVLGAFVPLIFGEVYETMKENGAAKGVPLALLSTFGVGVRNQTKATTLEQDVLKKLGDTTDYTKKASGGGEKKLIIR